ncbi:MAG: FGGY-family carbohydrate kinase [Sphaerochaeta sp.]|nr:FGGY-family carbohydrate kinase [Sphaerochaeta sp.]
MEHYILAIDGGTQSTKVVVFDLKGHEVCSYTVPLQEIVLYPDGRAEHPCDDLWTSLQTACRHTLALFPHDPKAIIGVGLGSIRCCRALMKEDGHLAHPVQSWMDVRLSSPYVHEDDRVAYVSATTGYLTYRLTGERKDTRSNYVGPWPIDPVTLNWFEDEHLFSSFTTPRAMLFELVDPATVLGTINAFASEATGIPVGLPVVATANDKAVEGLGSGLTHDGTVLVSLGTYITSMMAGSEHKGDSTSYWSNPGATKGEFVYESNGIRRGMSTISWIRELLGSDIEDEAEAQGLTPENYLNTLARGVPVGSGGLYTVLNWLSRPDHPHERGIMLGFNGTHKGRHMFRSIMEGIALTMKRNILAMCEERGIALTQANISGGGSQGDVFMQIFADVLGVPTKRTMVSGSASIGAAICVSLALDIYPSRDDAIQHMVHIKDTFVPIAEHVALYKEIDEKVYRHIALQVDGLLQASHAVLSK